MSIKKSLLEQNLLYRLAKIFYSVLPLFITAIIFLKMNINIHNISVNYLIYVAIGIILYFLIVLVVWKIFLYLVFGGLEDDTVSKSVEAPPQSTNSTSSTIPVTSSSTQMQLIPIFIIILILIGTFWLFQRGDIKLPNINFDFFEQDNTTDHQYGVSCTTSEGKTGLYGTNGNCLTCSDGTAVTNPINDNCSNGIAGIYCCSTTNGDNNNGGTTGCISTGCGSMWYCVGSYYLDGVEIHVGGLCYPNGSRPGDIYSGWSGTCRQCP